MGDTHSDTQRKEDNNRENVGGSVFSAVQPEVIKREHLSAHDHNTN
jgi:hypothetical protein